MSNKNYRTLLVSLNKRMNPDNVLLEKSFIDELRQIPYNDSLQYIKTAMRGVEPEYTRNTIIAGNKVRENLEKNLLNVSFEFQGSVMTNTHIFGYSDIDLLVISEKFFTYEKANIQQALIEDSIKFTYSQEKRLSEALNSVVYFNGMSDLRNLRLDCEQLIRNIYNYYDFSKPKSIKVTPTAPKRDVDVVIANWYNNVRYYLEDEKPYRGIEIFVKGSTQIFDSKLPVDFPFLSIKRINDKDLEVNNRLKKMIRFLKTIKYDSGKADELKLTSYDIYAICYDIETYKYFSKDYRELVLVIYNQLERITNDYSYRFNLKSVDEREYIFRNTDNVSENTEKTNSLKLIMEELRYIISDIAVELKLIA